MKRVLVVLFVLAASPLYAQQILLADVQAERAKFPAGRISGEAIGQIMNAVVAKHAAEGWRLMKKSGGNHCPQPVTGIPMSCDILLHLPSLHWVDALSDAEGDGTGVAAPSWGDHANGDMSQALEPVFVGGPPVPVPVPTPVPVPVPSVDWSGVYQRIEWSDANNERRYLDLKAEARAAAIRDMAHDDHMTSIDNDPSWLRKLVTNRLFDMAATAIGVIVTQQQLTKDKTP